MKEYTVVVQDYEYGVSYHYIKADEHESFISAINRYNEDVESTHPNDTHLKIDLEFSDVIAVFSGRCEEAPYRWWK